MTISKDPSETGSEETNEGYDKKSNKSEPAASKTSRQGRKKVNPIKFFKFLNSASSFWSKKFCLKESSN
jgi:hypothetical protein